MRGTGSKCCRCFRIPAKLNRYVVHCNRSRSCCNASSSSSSSSTITTIGFIRVTEAATIAASVGGHISRSSSSSSSKAVFVCMFQVACLSELQQWLSFVTDEHLSSFPLQRVLYALFLLLRGRRSGDVGGAATTNAHVATAEAAIDLQSDPVETAAPAAAVTASQEALDEQLARELAGGGEEVCTAVLFLCLSLSYLQFLFFCLSSSQSDRSLYYSYVFSLLSLSVRRPCSVSVNPCAPPLSCIVSAGFAALVAPRVRPFLCLPPPFPLLHLFLVLHPKKQQQQQQQLFCVTCFCRA